MEKIPGFRKRVVGLREQHHLTQEDVAQKLGIKREQVAKYENGTTIPKLPHAMRLADIYDVSLDWLCGRDEAHPLVKGGEQVTSEQLARQLALTRATLMGLIQALEDQGAIIPPPNLEERMAQHWDQAAQQLGIPDDGADVDLTALWPPRRRP